MEYGQNLVTGNTDTIYDLNFIQTGLPAGSAPNASNNMATDHSSSPHGLLSRPGPSSDPSTRHIPNHAPSSTLFPQPVTPQANTLANESSDHNGGLANPVHLLAEAAEEEAGLDLGSPGPHPSQADQASDLAESPQHNLPQSLRLLLDREPIHSVSDSIQVDTYYLIQGLHSMLSDTARRMLSEEDKKFFKPSRTQINRDLGYEYDPLDQALLVPSEVDAFFASFFQNLHPMLPVLDIGLHTPECQSLDLELVKLADLRDSRSKTLRLSLHGHLRTWRVTGTRRRRGHQTVKDPYSASFRRCLPQTLRIGRGMCHPRDSTEFGR